MNWIIGDVHGCANELNALINRITNQDDNAVLHFVGDYVDRGPNSKAVVDLIISLGKKAHAIRGNHDDIFDTILNGPSKYADKETGTEDLGKYHTSILMLAGFADQGMVETLQSYGVPKTEIRDFFQLLHRSHSPSSIEKLSTAFEHLRSYVPEEHKLFFKNLPLINEQKDFLCIHAYLPHHVEDNIAEWVSDKPRFQQEMLWGRFHTIAVIASKRWLKTGYFGHSPTFHYRDIGGYEPISGPQIKLIDTGCVFGGRLSACCHETGEVLQITKDNY